MVTCYDVEKSEPIISIIIPTYNNAQYLPQAIDSVISQNVTGCEIIVVDDGSTDDTAVILTQYADNIHALFQENAGSAAARNKGLAVASGAFIVFLDADDWLLPGKLVAQRQMLVERPSLGLAHSGWHVVDESGHLIQNVEPWHEIPLLDLEAWVWQKPIKMGAMMFRRSWLRQVGGFDETLRQAQDVDLLLRLALAGCPAAWLKQPTFCYRENQSSTIRKNAPQLNHYFTRVLDKFFAQPAVPEQIRTAEATIRYYSLRWLAWHFFETSHLAALDVPLQRALPLSPFPPMETVIDWVHYFATSCEAIKRPLHSMTQLWSHFENAVDPDVTWPVMKRMLTWWLDNLAAGLIGTDAKQQLVDAWPLWQTAVADEAALGISAETIVSWVCFVCRPLQQSQVKDAVAAAQSFSRRTPDELAILCKWFIVQNPAAIDAHRIVTFWQGLAKTGLITRDNLSKRVGLLLTLFGQQLLQRKVVAALRPFGLAVKYTFAHPSSVRQWGSFLQTAVSYYRQQKQADRKY